jgi:hypothetical protein
MKLNDYQKWVISNATAILALIVSIIALIYTW